MAQTARRKWTTAAALLITGAVAAALAMAFNGDEAPEYRLATVERGQIVAAVTASGTLAAVTTVQVGSQISGQIKEIYADFNSEVAAGQLIARLDPATYEARLKQAEANLALAQASVKTQQAAVAKARATLTNAEKILKRQRDLARQGVASPSALDNAEAAFSQSQAELHMAEAQVENAKAQVGAQEALVNQGRIDLERTNIRAPVSGTVISRDVDRGQTVAASLQAPVLFKIAQDLREMQVEARVDEADVGRVQVGQRATFTVDSFPGYDFAGRVEQIRKASTVVQNVVTYAVLVSATNDDLRLLPGLTANVRIVTAERSDVVKVPNAALRFRPVGAPAVSATPVGVTSGPAMAAAPQRQGRQQNDGAETVERLTRLLDLTADQQQRVKAIVAQGREQRRAARRQGARDGAQEEGQPANSAADAGQAGARRAAVQQARLQVDSAIAAVLTPEQRAKYQAARAERTPGAARRGQVWTIGEDGEPQPIDLQLGLSDGLHTEVLRGAIAPGDQVIVGMAANASAGRARGLPRLRF